MKLDLTKSIDIGRAKTYLETLIKKGSKIELKQYRPKRTNRQNAYFHVCCGLLSDYSGYTIDEVKKIIKDQLEFMKYEKGGHIFYRSSSDLDTLEFTKLVDHTRSFGEDHGCYIPTPEQYYETPFDVEKLIDHVN